MLRRASCHKTAFITYANVSSAAQRKLPGPKLDSHRHRAYLQYNQRELSMRLTRLNTSSAYLPGTRLGLGQCVPFSYITLYSSYPLSPETLYKRGCTRHETIDKDLIITFYYNDISNYQSYARCDQKSAIPPPYPPRSISPLRPRVDPPLNRQDVLTIQDPQEDRLDAKETSWFPGRFDVVWFPPPTYRCGPSIWYR